jgi:hypothetical protein
MPRKKSKAIKSLDSLEDATNMEVEFFMPRFVPNIAPPTHGQNAHSSKSKKKR